MMTSNTTPRSEPEFDTLTETSSDSFHSIPQSLCALLDDSFCSFPKNFNVVHINAQSIPSHFPDFLSSFDNRNIHAVLVSETFFKPCLPSTSYSLPGFHLIRNDRTGKGGGGVAIYLRSHIPFTILDKSPTMYSESAEYLLLEVLFGNLKLLLGVFYSPSLHIDYFDNFEGLLEQYTTIADHTIVMGDFNTCLMKDDWRARRLKHIVDSSNLNILPTNATHFFPNCTPSLLDLMIVSAPNYVDYHGQHPADAFSYHDLIFASYRIRPPKAKPTVVMRRSFKNFNNQAFLTDFNNIDWTAVYCANSIDDKLSIFSSLLVELFDCHAPLRPIKLKHLPAPWLTQDIKILMAKRNSAKCKYKLCPTDANHMTYKKLRNRCSKACRDAQRSFIHTSIENSNTTKVWKFLNSLGIGRQRKTAARLPDLDSLNQFFSSAPSLDSLRKLSTISYLSSLPIPDYPTFHFTDVSDVEIRKHVLSVKSDAVGCDGISRRMILMLLDDILPVLCHLFNFSLFSCKFPDVWRSAFVIPIPKITNPHFPSHFRPISILPFLSKVLERIVNKQLSLFLYKNNVLSPFQSGFRPGHSTVTALTKVCDDVRQGIDNKMVTVLALLDFSNAFNTVDFDLLLAILKSLNISSGVTDWFRTYLCGRQQCIRVDNKCSAFSLLYAGVPQGGVLSPLLFSIFINSITSVIFSPCHFYADDLQIYISATVDNIAAAIATLNSDLSRISDWCKSYGLSVNPIKSQAIILGNPKLLSKLHNIPAVSFDGVQLPLSDTVRDLGLVLDSSLSWRPQVAEVSRKIFATMGYLRRWKYLLPIKTKTVLANTLLLPILDYGDICYPDLTQELLHKLERLQNMCVRFVFNLRKYDHVSQYRKQLKWLSVGQRRNVHMLTLLYSILYLPQTPSYLKDRFHFLGTNNNVLVLRSSSDNKLEVPLSRTGFYGNSFTSTVVNLWNSLPAEIRQAKSLNSFKDRLKVYYLSI